MFIVSAFNARELSTDFWDAITDEGEEMAIGAPPAKPTQAWRDFDRAYCGI